MDTPAHNIRALATQYFASRALHVVASLDIAGQLAGGGQAIDVIASRVSAHPDALLRVMRALTSVGVFHESPSGVFANTVESALLVAQAPGSLRDLVLLFAEATAWRSWEALEHTVRTGEPAFEKIHGASIFAYLGHHAEEAARFDAAMAAASTLVNAAIIEAYDFSQTESVVDVAGGVGAALCGVLRAHPRLLGTVFDLPHVEGRALEYIELNGLSARCKFVGGSFFESMPENAGVYFLKSILHDWGNADCIRILRACRAAARPGSRLLICERLLDETVDSVQTYWIDLHMMLCTPGGRERTLAEYQALMMEAGFECSRVISTSSPWSLIEGCVSQPGD